jgi:hypothetical protein
MGRRNGFKLTAQQRQARSAAYDRSIICHYANRGVWNKRWVSLAHDAGRPSNMLAGKFVIDGKVVLERIML